ncbi:MAG: 1-acyl-sn-glycerol-3-phosphate acyltransferase [Pseudomonadota bacterium]
MRRLLDATLGRAVRHFLFLLVRAYYALGYNVSMSGKHLLQDNPGALILATHVSRHDGPLLLCALYTTARVRPIVHYNEYHNKVQWLPMFTISAIPVSSPRNWDPERRAAFKAQQLGVVRKVMERGNPVLLFPGGESRQQERELVPPKFTGAYDVMNAAPDVPVLLARIDGLGRFQKVRHDHLLSFIGIRRGRRHVRVDIAALDGLDPTQPIEAFNTKLETLLNTPIPDRIAAPASAD